MKIKTIEMSYEQVLALPKQKPFAPKKVSLFFRLLLLIVSAFDLFRVKFKCRKINMDRLGKKEPCLILMNHSSFIDLEIAATVLFPRRFNIICTSDGFIGKNWLMRQIGRIPTKKFITDARLVRNMIYTVKKLKSSVVMYPEAGYTLDGTATVLPKMLGKCLKTLDVPVVMIRTFGAFTREPLYNGLQPRRVKVSAEMEYILSREDIKQRSVDELNDILAKEFSFDNFRWQQENKVVVNEDFRADYLNRVLYKCPHCMAESMSGEGIYFSCNNCGKKYELTELGFLKATDGDSAFTHVPDWFDWQRQMVKEEIKTGEYKIEIPVDICMLVNTKSLYKVGIGTLIHSNEGFLLEGCDGKLKYSQPINATYSLNVDYYWYEIGDVVSIGNSDVLYYCFPKSDRDVVTKMRLAAEEMYKDAEL